MEFRGDERAVVIQIGAVLLLGAIVIAMAGYQATVVPDQNNEIEFNHNQQVQGEMQDLRNGIVSTAGGSGGSSYSLTLGTTYPARTLFVNPGPPSGQLRTLGTGNILIENANATGSQDSSVHAYWNGTNRTVNTTAFAYRPNYNELKSAPTTIYEHSLLYNAHPTGANTTVTDQVLVDGNEITLVTLAGEVQESSSGTASVNVRTDSASTSSVTVTDDGSPIRITVPTRSPTVWAKALPANATVVGNTTAGGGDYVRSTIELAPGEYELRMARATIGDGGGGSSPDTDAEYLVEVDDGGPVAAGESTDVVAEVRNRHNNPVKNAEVQYAGSRGSGTKTTDRNGRVRIPSEGGDNVTAWIDASDYGSAEKYERVAIEVPTSSSGGGGGSSSAYRINWANPTLNSSNDGLADCSDDSCTWDVGASDSGVLALDGDANDNIDDVNVDFRVNDTAVGEVAPRSTNDTGDGHVWTDLTANANGTVGVYVLSSGSSDRIDITVENMSGGGGNAAPTAEFSATCSGDTCEFDASGSEDPDGSVSTYEWAFGDGMNGTGETATHTYAADGNYEVTLTVTDDDGAEDTATRNVSVTSNSRPSAAFTSSCSGRDCEFDASSSGDSDGTIERYKWQFGDGATVDTTDAVVTHTYDTGGTYNVTLTVTDDGGATDSVTKSVEITGSVDVNGDATASVGSETGPGNSKSGTRSIVEFTITNNRSADVGVTAITVNSTTSAATEINDGNIGVDSSEVQIDAGDDGSIDGDADATNGYAIGSEMPVDTVPNVSSNGDARITFVEFLNGGNVVEMSGESMTVTVHYVYDGERHTTTETVSVS